VVNVAEITPPVAYPLFDLLRAYVEEGREGPSSVMSGQSERRKRREGGRR
jgi:hypothetical protein